MLGQVDTFEFDLALELKKTVAEMRATMPQHEYHQWISYYRKRQAEDQVRPRG